MKQKIAAYKWLLLAICIVGCDVGWNIYQNQSFKQEINLKAESLGDLPCDKAQIVQVGQYLKEEDDKESNENISREMLNEENDEVKQQTKVNKELKEDDNQEVPIYICGAIKQPGVYYVDSTAIVDEVIKLGGGLTKEADETAINLASPIQPYQKIIVPKIGEEIDKSGDSYENRERTEIVEAVPNGAIEKGNERSTYVKQENGLVNINTATKEELMTLNGIGGVKADSIITYRQENGGFGSIDELMQISGIGEKTFEKIKQFITT